MIHNAFNTLREFDPGDGRIGKLFSLPALEQQGIGRISRLPVSVRIVLESVLRNCDGKKITEQHVSRLAGWRPDAPRIEEIPFVVSRIVLQDFTGIPLLCDLAAMRGVAMNMGKDPRIIEPMVPVDLVVDHSVQVDCSGAPGVLERNMEIEFGRNRERYQFLKWGMNAFKTFRVIPPGTGIVHQVNLEYLARGVHEKGGVYYPDTLVGADSHTTMINAIGVVGWGVGGIEAEAGMLGQPVYFLTPDVVGVNLKGRLPERVTAADLALTVTELLRAEKVVGKFVEFFGEGTSFLSVPDRATVSNMAPEYGATMGFFPVDDITVDFLRSTGKSDQEVSAFEAFFKAQGIYGVPRLGDVDYSRIVELDISKVVPSVSGPRRPQDRVELRALGERFAALFPKPVGDGGFGKAPGDLKERVMTRDGIEIGSGDVMIAAIASCTNTSNPRALITAGLLARNALHKGLTAKRHVKTSLTPGSRVVTEYLKNAGLLPHLEELGFHVAAYGCATCIGNAGPLDEGIEEAIIRNDLVCASVLSGNRNFEARIHPNLRANFLMSPPLVVAFAIAGTVLIDLEAEPLGVGKDGQEVYLRDIWPDGDSVASAMKYATDRETFRKVYDTFSRGNPLWDAVPATSGDVYDWPQSTYIAEPPFFSQFGMQPGKVKDVVGARALGIFGDSVTTDHISPAGSIKPMSPAGRYLSSCGVAKADFQSFGTRRGNHEVMVRGTFSNVRIKNLMVPPDKDGNPVEGGLTLLQPSRQVMDIYDAATAYIEMGVPTLIFGGEEYGSGSSRDWAAKGPLLLGVRAVIAKSFERIHRSNLVGMGILPLQFETDQSVRSLGIKGDEEFDILGLDAVGPHSRVTLIIRHVDRSLEEVSLVSRIETPIEAEYFRHGGILPYVLRALMGGA